METQVKHTPGAIAAAEIITKARINTGWDSKTIEGVANLIDQKTAAPELLEACELVEAAYNKAYAQTDIRFRLASTDIPYALATMRAAIALAKKE